MRLKFWGTRGSIPVSMTAELLRTKLRKILQLAAARPVRTDAEADVFLDTLDFGLGGTFGGHSSCVQIITDLPEHVILDLGTGVRPLGQTMLERFGAKQPQVYHIFLSHLHWDHIMGFPFFAPAYIPGNQIIIHTCHANAEDALRRQQDSPSFPVLFDQLGADIRFDVLVPGQAYDIAGLTVSALLQHHVGDSYGWRFDRGGKSVVYSTDSEHQLGDDVARQKVVAFFRSADAVIFDAMYSLADAISVKADWGHSSNIVGVELCQEARAQRLVLFHHEPASDDSQLQSVLNDTQRLEAATRDGHAVQVLAAWDGLELVL